MPRLAKRFTVIAVDLRGIGGSKATAGGYDAANMAEDVRQLVSLNGATPAKLFQISTSREIATWWSAWPGL
jgi:pimeloyl-ACP methyl ester carboxylesterase